MLPARFFAFALTIASAVSATPVVVDSRFTPVIENNDQTSPILRLARTADGGLVAAGSFSRVGTARSHGLVRFTPQYSVDTAFPDVAPTLACLPDSEGRIYVATDLAYGPVRVLRLNHDGSIDSTFTYRGTRRDLAGIQPSGDIVVSDGGNGFDLVKPDGSIVARYDYSSVLAVLSDGSLICEEYNFSTFVRHLLKRKPDGSIDPGFASAEYNTNGATSVVRATSDGHLYVGATGATTYGGTAVSNLFRLSPDGTVDSGFKPDGAVDLSSGVRTLVPATDGSVVTFDGYRVVSARARYFAVRFTSTGAVDTSFVPSGVVDYRVADAVVDGDGIIAAGAFDLADGTRHRGLLRLLPTGAIDPNFPNAEFGSAGTVSDVLPLIDGAMLVAGSFTQVNNQPAAAVVKLRSDGSVDPSFNVGTGAVDAYSLGIDSKGRVIVGGPFWTFGTSSDLCLVRLNPDGSVDQTFHHQLSNLYIARKVIVGADDAVTVIGMFNADADGKRITSARVTATGARDPDFDSTTARFSASGDGSWVIPQADGSLVLGGRFVTSDWIPATGTGLFKLEPNGALDGSYRFTGGIVSTSSTENATYDAAALEDESLVVGGAFDTISGWSRPNLARILTDGTVDPTFAASSPPDAPVNAVTAMSDGRVLISGAFSSIGALAAPGIAVLKTNGQLDANVSFRTTYVAKADARELGDGSLLLFGRFLEVGGTNQPALARVRIPADTTAPVVQLSNLSVRSQHAAGDSLIVGFGAGEGAKRILVRAAGPALAKFGLSGTISDPQLKVIRAGDTIAQNDDWDSALVPTFNAVGAFPFALGSKDAAVVANSSGLASGVITGDTGLTLVEAYDCDSPADPTNRLINLSARGKVGAGDKVLIAGFHIAGSGHERVLIRAIGPGLAAFGVGGTLADPKVELYDAAGKKIGESDNWDPMLAPLFNSASAFPIAKQSQDAALVINLAGDANYSAHVKSADGTTGEALVEIYEVPAQ